MNAYLTVMNDARLSNADTTDDLQAGIYSLLIALSSADAEVFSGTTPLEAYVFVEARLRALNISPYLLRRYMQTVAGRVAKHSQGR